MLLTLLVNRIKEETKTAIIIPSDSEKKSVIRIEGSPQGVAKAKAEILEMATKLVSSGNGQPKFQLLIGDDVGKLNPG